MTAQPELGQLLFGQPTGDFGTPGWVDSMMDGILDTFGVCYWNINQKSFERCYEADVGPVHFRPYSWADDGEDAGPNFWIDGDPQQIRWYKHPGRGQSCALEYTPDQWIAWHDKVHAACWAASDQKFNERCKPPTASEKP